MSYEFYVTIQGKKQGQFKGESLREREKGKIPALRFVYEVKSPRDAATGQASGKRQHSPITITKEWGAASPQLFQALVMIEGLESVLFEFIQTGTEGAEEVYYTINLTNATIANLKQYLDHRTYAETATDLTAACPCGYGMHYATITCAGQSAGLLPVSAQ